MGRKSHPFFDKREYHRTKREGLTRLGQNGSEGWARFRSSAELVGILQSIGYLMEEGDITWDSTTRLATIRAVEQKLDPSNGLEKPTLSGKGAQASYTMALTTQYDEIEPLGDGYFLAQKYTGETNVGLGVRHRQTRKCTVSSG